MTGDVKDKVDKSIPISFYTKSENDKKSFEELKQSYPELYRAYSDKKSSGEFSDTFPRVVRLFNNLVDLQFNKASDSERLCRISKFVSRVLPLTEKSKKGDVEARKELSKAVAMLNSGKYQGSGNVQYSYEPEEYVPIRLTNFEENTKRREALPKIDRLTRYVDTVKELLHSATEGLVNTIIPRSSYRYGYEPPAVVKPIAKAAVIVPQRVNRFISRDLPEVAGRTLDNIPGALSSIVDASTKSVDTAASIALKRLGWTGGGALAGAGVGLGLSRGLLGDEYSGYDVPIALIGAGLGGLSSYYLSEDDNKLLKLIKHNRKLLETASSAAVLGLLYRSVAEKPTVMGTALATLAGSALPSAIREVVRHIKSS